MAEERAIVRQQSSLKTQFLAFDPRDAQSAELRPAAGVEDFTRCFPPALT